MFGNIEEVEVDLCIEKEVILFCFIMFFIFYNELLISCIIGEEISSMYFLRYENIF